MHGTLSVIDLPEPEPAEGQLVLNVASCGICGSDLHAKDHADELSRTTAEMGYRDMMRSDTPVVMGHEFFVPMAASTSPGFPRLRRAGMPSRFWSRRP